MKATFLLIALGIPLLGCQAVSRILPSTGDGQVVQVDQGTCLNLTAESRAHPVGVCEFQGKLSFRVGPKTLSYDKKKYIDGLRERLFSFIRSTSYPWKSLTGAKVDVWLQAPMFTPTAVQLTVVVQAPLGSFAVDLPIEPHKWMIRATEVKLIPSTGYPSVKVKQGGRLALYPKPHVTLSRLNQFLKESGLKTQVSTHGQIIRTPLFQEAQVISQLKSHGDAGYLLDRVEFVRAAEVDASTAKGFSFLFFDEK